MVISRTGHPGAHRGASCREHGRRSSKPTRSSRGSGAQLSPWPCGAVSVAHPCPQPAELCPHPGTCLRAGWALESAAGSSAASVHTPGPASAPPGGRDSWSFPAGGWLSHPEWGSGPWGATCLKERGRPGNGRGCKVLDTGVTLSSLWGHPCAPLPLQPTCAHAQPVSPSWWAQDLPHL